MHKDEVLQLIRRWIVTNGNREITASVLNPILEAILLQPNGLIGNLQDLQTEEKTSLVAAINEMIQKGGGGVSVYTGAGHPGATPPAEVSPGDFYLRVSDEGNEIYQFDGTAWSRSQTKAPRVSVHKMGRVPTAGEETRKTEIVAHVNAGGFVVDPFTVNILEFTATAGGIPNVRQTYFFTENDRPGGWGNDTDNGPVSPSQLILNFSQREPESAQESREITLGEIGEMGPAEYINANTEPLSGAWNIAQGEDVVFSFSQSGATGKARYIGRTPIQMGAGETRVFPEDFKITESAGRPLEEWTLIPDDGSITIDEENHIRVNVEGWDLAGRYVEKIDF